MSDARCLTVVRIGGCDLSQRRLIALRTGFEVIQVVGGIALPFVVFLSMAVIGAATKPPEEILGNITAEGMPPIPDHH